MSQSSKHLSLNDRILILKLVNTNQSMRSIGRKLGVSASTISRELQKHRTLKKANPFNNVKFTENCKSSRVTHAPWICHGCKSYVYCRKDKYIYDPTQADKSYHDTLVSSRHKVACGQDAFDYLNHLLKPLIKDKSQSFDHVYASISDQIGISKSTLYRYIDKGYLKDVRNLDLPRRVRYRATHKSNEKKVTKDTKIRVNRTYLDFLAYCATHPRAYVCEIDSVIGIKSDNEKVLLTILFRNSNFMLAFIRNRNDAQSVVDIFNSLEAKLGYAKFASLFHITLGDNGSEFASVDALEANHRKLHRCHFFYCDARSSEQKGKLEKNHQYIRKFFPQGTSLNCLTQKDVNNMMNHINSTKRDYLGNKSPFECLTKSQASAIKKLGYLEIDRLKVTLNLSLFKK